MKPNVRFKLQSMFYCLLAGLFTWSGGYAISEGWVEVVILCLFLSVFTFYIVWREVISRCVEA